MKLIFHSVVAVKNYRIILFVSTGTVQWNVKFDYFGIFER